MQKIPFCFAETMFLACLEAAAERPLNTGLSNDRNHHNHQAAPLICTRRPGRGWRRLWCSNMMTVTSKRPTPARQPGPGAAQSSLSAVHLTFISFKSSQWTIKNYATKSQFNNSAQLRHSFKGSHISNWSRQLRNEIYSFHTSLLWLISNLFFPIAVLPGSKERLLDINTGVALVTLHWRPLWWADVGKLFFLVDIREQRLSSGDPWSGRAAAVILCRALRGVTSLANKLIWSPLFWLLPVPDTRGQKYCLSVTRRDLFHLENQ